MKKRLGRGLDALFGEDFVSSEIESEVVEDKTKIVRKLKRLILI